MLRRECLSWLGVSLCLGVVAATPAPLWAQPPPPTPRNPLRLPDVKFEPTARVDGRMIYLWTVPGPAASQS